MRTKGKKIAIIGVGAALVLITTAALQTKNGDFRAGRAVEIFYNVLRTINTEYVDPVDNDKLLRKATDEMLSTLDPYTIYLDEEDMEGFRLATTGKYGGVGSLVKPSKGGKGYPTISNTYSGFPMDKAGVTPGDTLISIDGVDVKGLELSKVTDMMKGNPGTTVEMTFHKLRGGTKVTYPIKREIIHITPVEYYGLLDGGVGYITFNNFSNGGAQKVREAFEALRATGKLNSLILDLRGNGGGLVSEAVSIVSMFVPKGSLVVSMRGRDPKDNREYRTTTKPIDTEIPVAVMIDRSSASASEIVAGAFQDMDRGYIVGSRSFGKGLVQVPRPVGYNTYVKVTVSKYYTPSGRCIQALDYTHRNDDGSVEHIPDSLISEFKSTGGRTLYDGGGIMPDSVIKADYLSLFTASIAARGYIDDFATLYYKRNTKAASIEKFKLTDKDYRDFIKFLEGKEIEFESKSEEIVQELRKTAERERSLDGISTELDIIEKTLKARDRGKAFADPQNKKDLISMLEMEIMAKYYFSKGRAQRLAITDPDIKIAQDVLQNKKHYNYVLKHKSPAKN